MLQQVYGRNYSGARYQEAQSALLTLNHLLRRLEHSTLSGNEFGILAFYSRFIFGLEERIAFLTRVCELLSAAAHKEASAHPPKKRIPVSIHCPDGIIQKIAPAAGTYFKPIRVQPGSSADIACAGCIYPAVRYIEY